jgi:hypothetical protein
MVAIKSTPIAATEMLLNLTPLALFTMVEVRMAPYRLHILKQTTVPKAVSGLLTIWKNVSDPLLDMRLDYTIPGWTTLFQSIIIFSVIIRPGLLEKQIPSVP